MAQTGGSVRKLEERPWWPELVMLKDVLSLRELAERYGVAPAAISNALKRNDLTRAPAPPGPRNKRDEAVVKRAKDALAIVGDGAPAKPADAAEPAPKALSVGAPAGVGKSAWKVTIGTQDFFVMADDIVEAARAATSSNRGGVQKIELVGRAIVG